MILRGDFAPRIHPITMRFYSEELEQQYRWEQLHVAIKFAAFVQALSCFGWLAVLINNRIRHELAAVAFGALAGMASSMVGCMSNVVFRVSGRELEHRLIYVRDSSIVACGTWTMVMSFLAADDRDDLEASGGLTAVIAGTVAVVMVGQNVQAFPFEFRMFNLLVIVGAVFYFESSPRGPPGWSANSYAVFATAPVCELLGYWIQNTQRASFLARLEVLQRNVQLHAEKQRAEYDMMLAQKALGDRQQQLDGGANDLVPRSHHTSQTFSSGGAEIADIMGA